jgi:hypothetical protein
MPTPGQDLVYYKAGMREMEAYLLSESLFQHIDGELPLLSVGGILLAGKRLKAQLTEVGWLPLQTQLDRIRMKWRSRWEQKASLEEYARIRQWTNSLQDIRENSDAAYYSQQVNCRVMLQLLKNESSAEADALKEINSLDAVLYKMWHPGKFIWSPTLSAEFPEDLYWFLYGTIQFN